MRGRRKREKETERDDNNTLECEYRAGLVSLCTPLLKIVTGGVQPTVPIHNDKFRDINKHSFFNKSGSKPMLWVGGWSWW